MTDGPGPRVAKGEAASKGSGLSMTDGSRTGQTAPPGRKVLTTPRAAAIAGIAFAVLLGTSMVLLRLSLPDSPAATSAELTPGRRTAVTVALALMPYAGIAFLWFIGVVRDRIGDFEDRFFATVFLGSGLIFLTLLFCASAMLGGLAAATGSAPVGPDVWSVGKATSYTALNVYATKMAGVFMISTATIALRTRVLPAVAGNVGIRPRRRHDPAQRLARLAGDRVPGLGAARQPANPARWLSHPHPAPAVGGLISVSASRF